MADPTAVVETAETKPATENAARPLAGPRSFARAPFFHLVFAHAAQSADITVLEGLLKSALRREPAFPTYILEAAARRFAALGDLPRTVRALRAAAVIEPRQSAAIASLAALAERAGRPVSPLWSAACRILLAGGPIHLSGVLTEVADATFETESYLTILKTLAQTVAPDTYLEIGIGPGWSQECFRGTPRTIGIDPAPKADLTAFPDLEFFHGTSDAYFASLEGREDRPRADVIFIDGLHESDQVLRDFVNAETVASPGALVILHDVIPLDPLSAAKDRKILFWAGDCWRALHFLANHRPDLDIAVIPAAPSGLAVIRLPERPLPEAERPSLDGFDAYAERLDLNRDLGPMLLGFTWLKGDAAGLRAFAAGEYEARGGSGPFEATADDALMVSAAGTPHRHPDRPMDPLTRLRLRLIWDPASRIDTDGPPLLGLTALTAQTGSQLYRILMRGRCVQPTDTNLSTMAGLILDTFHDAGRFDLLTELKWGRLLANPLDRTALLDARLRTAFANLVRTSGEPLDAAVRRAMDRIGERIESIARACGTTPAVVRRLAHGTAAALLFADTEGAMEAADGLEAWTAHTDSRGASDGAAYNRIGYFSGRPVPDARVTRRPFVDRTTLSTSHNSVRVATLPRGFITEGMLAGSRDSGLLLGDFLGFARDRRPLADPSLRRDVAGLVSLSPDRAVIHAAKREVPVAGVAIPGLNSEACKVFGHFILESLGRTLAARENCGDMAPTLVLPKDIPDFVEPIYQLFGFESFVHLEPGDRAVADRVCLADTSEEALANFALYDIVRDAASTLAGPTGPARIYLSRRGLTRRDRYEINETEVEARLARAGFTIVRPETLPFVEQIGLYRGAEVIASPYGSALHVAALFAKPGTRIVEAVTRRSARDLVTFHQALGHDYRPVPARFVDPAGQGFELDVDGVETATR